MMSVTEIDVLSEWQDSQPAAPLRRDAGPAGVTPRGGQRVTLERVSKAFGERSVLRDIDLRVASGEFVALIGRSGCGKSTLLRLLAGLEAPTSGALSAGGDTGDAARGAAETRFMFQDARLLPWARVLDNVALGLRGPDATARAREALAQVGLADRANEWPARLSGGQRQRVALARALVHAPKLLLLDEPLGALDALTRIDMQQLIEALWTRHRFTALLVKHDVAEAVALADRVLLIENGGLALDLRVDLPRPRRRDAAFAAIEQRLLDRVLGTPAEAGREDLEASERAARDATSMPAARLRWAV